MNDQQQVTRLKVLVCAELANPEWVSVPLVGWNHLYALSQHADVHVVTHERNREGISRSGNFQGQVTYIKSGWLDKVFDYLAFKVFRFHYGSQGLTALKIPFYWHFEWIVYRKFRQALRKRQFDIVHRITPVSPVIGSPLAGWCRYVKVPFVIGPLNGGLPWPDGYGYLKRESGFIRRFRQFYRFVPYVRSTLSQASAVILGSKFNFQETPLQFHPKCFYLPENGIRESQINHAPRSIPRRPIQVIFAGRLVPMKGCNIVIQACAPLVRDGDLELHVMGDGGERALLEQMVKAERMEQGAHFYGWCSQEQVLAKMGQCDVFAFPSIREFGGGVVIEAAAKGLVPIVMDFGGPAEIVRDETGFRLPLGNTESTVQHLRSILEQLIRDPARIQTIGEAARQQMLREFAWEQRIHKTLAIYRYVMGVGPRPTMSPPT